MAERSYRWILWSLVVFGLALDLGSKYGVFYWLYSESDDGRYVVVPGAFMLLTQYTTERELGEHPLAALRTISGERIPKVNHGALFGLGQKYVWLANALFGCVSVAAAIAIAIWSMRPTTAKDPFLCIALGLILGGALGNLFDRIVFGGVRDFLYFHWIEWPVFNIADCCLVCGAGILLLQAFLNAPEAKSAEAGTVMITGTASNQGIL